MERGDRVILYGEDVSARRSHTAEPFLAVTGNMFGHRKRESATRYTPRERAGEMNVRDVARRIGGQDSHPGFHRALPNGSPLDALIRLSKAFDATTAGGRQRWDETTTEP